MLNDDEAFQGGGFSLFIVCVSVCASTNRYRNIAKYNKTFTLSIHKQLAEKQLRTIIISFRFYFAVLYFLFNRDGCVVFLLFHTRFSHEFFWLLISLAVHTT